MHEFRLWAPIPKKVAVQVDGKQYPMEGPGDKGRWKACIEEAQAGSEYGFLLDEDTTLYPDPRSLSQPKGVHGVSAVYDQKAFQWSDTFWQGPPLSGSVIYELHIGTFSQAGTFDGAIEHLDYLCKLGITHIELMPVAEWAGDRGWGYDGVDLFAVSAHYGGPDGLKRLVDACHAKGIGVVLDVVYNHFGPVGNYTGKFGPYLTEKHHTPWGAAINYEDRGSDEVRSFFLDNASMWMEHFHVDGLRLDAIHEITDRSAVHFLEQLSANVNALSAKMNRRFFLIAESDLNDPKIVRSIEAGGFGMDAQWSDDFHHSLATLVFTEPGHKGYYDDFGAFESLAKSLKEVFVFDGQYSKYRDRSHGRPVDGLSAHHFIGFIQNHDQIGNRALGDRIHESIGIVKTQIALGLVLTAPQIPMLFMGEEYAASTPFLYFADHDDPEMARLVSEGRKKEFADFGFDGDEIPNPEDPDSFMRSKLDWGEICEGDHAMTHDWVRDLIHIRRSSGSLNDGDRGHMRVTFDEDKRWLRMDRNLVSVFMNLGKEPANFKVREEHRLLLTNKRATTGLIDGNLTIPAESFVIVSAESE